MSDEFKCLCFHYGNELIWDNNFSFEDYGYEGDGIVHAMHCPSCNADVEYRISFEEEGANDC